MASGAIVRRNQRDGGNGGFSDYEIEGTFDEVSAGVGSILQEYDPRGYGTFFNWPPGAFPERVKDEPTDLGDGRWIARGYRSHSCE